MEFLRILFSRTVKVTLLAVIVTGCGSDSSGSGCGQQPKTCQETFTCEVPDVGDRMLQGKEFLSDFKGERAREVFLLLNDDYLNKRRKSYCPAVYGVVLADLQRATKKLNSLVLDFVVNTLAGSPATPAFSPASLGDGASPFKPQATGQDYGNLLENAWSSSVHDSSMEGILSELSNYASAVTHLAKSQDCEFSIGLDEDYDSKLAANPYKFVLNFGDSETPVIQLVFRARLDGSEARLFNGVSRSILGAANLVLAHDYTMTIDLAKILYQLGFPVAECISQDLLACSQEFTADTDLILERALGWAFLFQDNPTLLGRDGPSETDPDGRWERRFPYIDDEFATGFYAMRTFFPSLVARAANLRDQEGAAQRLSEYLILYQDGNDNDQIDSLDTLGLNIDEVKFDPTVLINRGGLSDAEAAEMRGSFETLENTVNSVVLGVLKSFSPTAESIGEAESFIERVYGNMKAVDHDNIEYEPIPIDSFNSTFQELLLGTFSGNLPNFMDFDVRSYFTDPKPIREFMPRWHRTSVTVPVESYPEPLEIRLAEFLMDSDDYAFSATDGSIHPTNLVEFMDDNPPLVSERAVFGGTYNGGILGELTNIGWPSDCLNGTNLTTVLSSSEGQRYWPVFYFNLPDPSLNGMVNVNLSAWDPYYDPTVGNGALCANDTAGRQPATNYTVSKSMWMFADYVIDNLDIVQLLGLVSAAP